MCNLHTWLALAVTDSIALCTMDGMLALEEDHTKPMQGGHSFGLDIHLL